MKKLLMLMMKFSKKLIILIIILILASLLFGLLTQFSGRFGTSQIGALSIILILLILYFLRKLFK